jgi:hypothetical protein
MSDLSTAAGRAARRAQLDEQSAADGLSPHARAELDALARVEGPRQAEAILTIHQRHRGGCLCGGLELGGSHPAHQVDMLREALQPGPALTPGALAASLGSAQPPLDAVMGSLTTWARDDGSVGVEGTAGPLLSVSLAAFAQQHDGPRAIHVRDGMVVFAGYDRDGDPVEFRYRAVGLQLADTQYLAAQEGGFLLLELLP